MPHEHSAPQWPKALPEVQLVDPTESDIDVIAHWGQDPQWCAAAEWSISSYDSCRAHLLKTMHTPPPELIRFVVRSSGVPVGYVDLFGADPSTRELGYVIGPRSRWGQGFATAAALAAVNYGFSSLQLTSVWAEAWAANPASIKVLTKVGFTQTGFGADGSYLGQPTRYTQWELTAAQWQHFTTTME